MTLITILLVLALERYWRKLDVYGLFARVVQLAQLLLKRYGNSRWMNSSLGVVLVIAPLMVATAIIQNYLACQPGFPAWLVLLAFSVTVLILSIGDKRFSLYVKQYLAAWQKQDMEAACRYLNDMTHEDITFENPMQLNHRFLEVLLGRVNERLLAILFWFVVLGPLGAVFYRSVAQLKSVQKESSAAAGFIDAATRLKLILDWFPARLTAVCYALSGSFVDAFHAWHEQTAQLSGSTLTHNRHILTSTGLGALQLHDFYTEESAELDSETVSRHVEHAHALIRRTVITWLTVLALLTLVGWLA